MLTVSAESSNTVPKVLEDPLNVCVALHVLAADKLTPAAGVEDNQIVPFDVSTLPDAPTALKLVQPLATGSTPVTPVVSGRPVKLVATPDVGVPSKGVTSVGLVVRTKVPLPVPVYSAAVR